jgi:hypothetical protein
MITKEEKAMIKEIEKKLSDINSENNFSDTNLVAKNIKNISQQQKTSLSYIYKCFYILLALLVSTRV